MSQLLRRFNILSWPIWAKLLAGFLVAGLVPLALLLLVILTSIQEVGAQNIEAFLTETATREARGIETGLARASETITLFTGNTVNVEKLRTVLPSDETVTINPINRADVVAEFQNQILNTGTSPLASIDLLDADGTLVVQALPGSTISMASGSDLSESAAYIQGVQASLSNRSLVIAVAIDEANQPIVDVVNVLMGLAPDTEEPVLLGYVVGHVAVNQVIFNNLLGEGEFLDATSRLVTRRGFVVDVDGARFEDNLLFNPDIFEAALAGNDQTEQVRLDDDVLLRYYAAIPNTPFVLVKESPLGAVSNQVIEALLSRAFALIVGIGFLVIVLVLLGNQLLSSPLQRVSQAIQAMTSGNYAAPLPPVRRGDEIGELAGNVADMRRRVLGLINDLEERIEARARDVDATREISRVAATQRDTQQLMEQVVNLIVERFPNIYHAQVFLIDNERHFAVLKSSTGEPGRQLLARGHRLGVGSASVIGRVTSAGEMVVARNTSTSQVHRHNEFLPDTLAELAIPLRVANRVIGALDVQSRQSDAFTTEQMDVLQTMSDQIAVAIENVRLYTESVQRLARIERERGRSTLQMWHDYISNERVQRLESAAGAPPQANHLDAVRQSALARGEVTVGEVTDRGTIPLAAPIRLRGQLLGAVEWEVPEAEYDDNKLLLAQDLTDQLAVNLESARLFQESQRATARERLVNELSASLTTQNDIEQIMQMAVREVGKALRSPQVSIRLSPQVNGQHSELVSDDGDK